MLPSSNAVRDRNVLQEVDLWWMKLSLKQRSYSRNLPPKQSLIPTIKSLYPQQSANHHFPVGFPYEITIFKWFSHSFPMVFPMKSCFSHSFPHEITIFPWFSHGFPMVFPWSRHPWISTTGASPAPWEPWPWPPCPTGVVDTVCTEPPGTGRSPTWT